MSLKDLKIFSTTGDDIVLPDIPDKSFLVVTAKENLIQRIIKQILTLKKSNVFATNFGSGIPNLLASNFKSASEISNVLSIYISSVKNNIIQEQIDMEISGEKLKDSEKLKDLILEEVNFDKLFNGWIIKLKIVTFIDETFINII